VRPVYCNGCGAIFARGIYSLSSEKLWEDGQIDPEHIRRDQVFPTLLPTFGKLNLPDKLAFSAASLALQSSPDSGGDRSGICIAVPYGSLTTDMFFMDSIINQFPSPTYFSATLPSSTIADIAIHYKFKGPDRIICGGDSPVTETLSNAFRLIQTEKADTILFLAVWAFDSINKSKLPDYSPLENAAFCFLFSTTPKGAFAQKCNFVLQSPSVQYDTATEYQFCIRLLDAIRGKEKRHITLQPETTENYLSIE
jgi:hypothetical protein